MVASIKEQQGRMPNTAPFTPDRRVILPQLRCMLEHCRNEVSEGSFDLSEARLATLLMQTCGMRVRTCSSYMDILGMHGQIDYR